MSDSTVFSHRDLLFNTHLPWRAVPGKGTKITKEKPLCTLCPSCLNKKLARTRGENLIHAVPPDLSPDPRGPLDLSLQPLTEPAVSHNFIRFQGYAREWFSVIFLEETLNLRSLLPVRDLTTYSSRSLRFNFSL
jgi:hypothetical protein